MCGLAGFLAPVLPEGTNAILTRMADAIRARGPDDSGLWTDAPAGVALAHRRLSVVDLSPAGHQPMQSAGGRFVIVFNGEIYNHLELRQDLHQQGHTPAWRGHADTETLLAGFDAWGVRRTVERCIGMFAFAVWDRQARVLVLGRDRLGEKPLYYGWQGASFLFGSDLKALKAHPDFSAAIDRQALTLFMRHNAVPAPYSIYQGIHKLTPGCLLQVNPATRSTQLEQYWDLRAVARAGQDQPFAGTPDEAVNQLEALLGRAVGAQMMADVPLGAFLSGGVDSSTVVALMRAHSSHKVRSFSIGFDEPGYNEAPYAKAVAQHLGTEHTELTVTARQAMDVIPLLPGLYAEPFADSSQIPTFLVSQLARQQVTVALSGDGGDELFAGYNRYLLAQGLWGKLEHLPMGLRARLARGIVSLSPSTWNKLAHVLQPLLPRSLRQVNMGDKLHKGAAVMAAHTPAELYRLLVSHWSTPEQVVRGGHEPPTVLTDSAQQADVDDFVQRMMALDTLTYLPDDILAKVDRAAMGVSLESRVPLLDHRVVEFAWSLPLDYKLRGGVSKWPLRQVLYRHVPPALIERPKMGFGIPIDQWLRGPLRAWAEALLDPVRLHHDGFFEVAPIRQKWAEHLSGQRNWQYLLWDVLMFQAWLAEQ